MASRSISKSKCEKSLIANYRKAANEYHAYLDFIMDETNVRKWYCRIRDISGRDDEFRGGEYIVEMLADDDYPFSPPKFYVRTPNGVYDGGHDRQVNICIGIGHFHKMEFAAGQGGMMGFIMMTLNGMMNWRLTGVGIGILHPEYFENGADQAQLDPDLNREKKALAQASRAYNRRHYPEIMAQFDDLPFPKILHALPHTGLPACLIQAIRQAITG